MPPKIANPPGEKEDECAQRVTVPQFTGTCWFNAVLMVLFYSDGMRDIIRRHIYRWPTKNKTNGAGDHIVIIFDTLREIVQGQFVRKNNDSYMKFFGRIKPMALISQLQQANDFFPSFRINRRKQTPEGGIGVVYLIPMLIFMGLSNFEKFLAVRKNKKDNTYMLCYDEFVRTKYAPDILIIETSDDHTSMRKKFLNEYDNGVLDENQLVDSDFVFRPEMQHRGLTYVVDGMMITNFNKKADGHQIAGVTCHNNRFMYNGYSINQVGNRYVTCPLIKHDWLDNSLKDFRLDDEKCALKYAILNKKDTNTDVFSNQKGHREYTYIRKDLLDTRALQSVSPSTSGKYVRRGTKTTHIQPGTYSPPRNTQRPRLTFSPNTGTTVTRPTRTRITRTPTGAPVRSATTEHDGTRSRSVS